jgi:hypothetical protein
MARCPLVNKHSQGTTIWLDSSGSAPSDKFLRVDYDPNDKVPPSSFQAALGILSQFAPTVIIPGQMVRVIHDFENSRIFLRLEPHHPKPPNTPDLR